MGHKVVLAQCKGYFACFNILLVWQLWLHVKVARGIVVVFLTGKCKRKAEAKTFILSKGKFKAEKI